MNTFMYLFQCLFVIALGGMTDAAQLTLKEFIVGIIEIGVLAGSYILLRRRYSCLKSTICIVCGILILWIILIVSELIYKRIKRRKR